MPKYAKRVSAVLLVVAALSAAGWLAYELGVPLPFLGAAGSGEGGPSKAADDPASADAGRQRVVALGRLEPAGGLIEVSGLVGDRMESLEVEEGSSVKKGQALAYLESRSLRQLQLRSAESQLQEAQARFAAEEKSADARILTASLAVKEAESHELDIKAQEKKLELLEANLDLARKDLSRLEDLSEDLVSDQERERQLLLVCQAEAELSAGRAALEKMKQTKELSAEAARADLLAAEASKPQVLTAIPIESLKNGIELAKLQWERTAVVAPCDGRILKIFTLPGESIGTEPILQMANLQQMVVVSTVYETDIKRVELGQRAVVRSETFKPPYDKQGLKGKVTRIGRLVTGPEMRSLDPFARADRHVVEVRIELDEEGCEQARHLSNLQVEVTVLTTGTPR